MLKQQQGSVLIEAMISLLLFLGGMLALISLTAASINQVSQTKHRNDASNLTSEIIGQMYTDWDGTTAYDHAAWDAKVAQELPGGVVNNFVITPITINATTNAHRVDIVLSWSDKGGAAHNYTSSTTVMMK